MAGKPKDPARRKTNTLRIRMTDAERELVEAAAQAASAHDFIMRLPDGYDTVIGERGASLSGGERQRVSIARALLKDASIVILDEPTSAIDIETEADIIDALERLIAGRTTLVIAHRLTTVRRADRVLVMEGGRIVESGAPAKLLRRKSMYRRLHDLQHGSSTEPSGRAAPRRSTRKAGARR